MFVGLLCPRVFERHGRLKTIINIVLQPTHRCFPYRSVPALSNCSNRLLPQSWYDGGPRWFGAAWQSSGYTGCLNRNSQCAGMRLRRHLESFRECCTECD